MDGITAKEPTFGNAETRGTYQYRLFRILLKLFLKYLSKKKYCRRLNDKLGNFFVLAVSHLLVLQIHHSIAVCLQMQRLATSFPRVKFQLNFFE